MDDMHDDMPKDDANAHQMPMAGNDMNDEDADQPTSGMEKMDGEKVDEEESDDDMAA